MKKLMAFLLSLTMLVALGAGFTSCSPRVEDWADIQEKGEFVCGITLTEPMNYFPDPTNRDMSTLTGFDTELARLVAAKLGVEVKFQVIEWGLKYMELQSGTIDCIWNGFTSNSKDDDGIERKDKVDFTYAYLDNAQCVVVKKSELASFTSAAALKDLVGVAEDGSAGETYAKSVSEKTVIGVGAQMDAFAEIKAGAAQFAVVDVLLAEKTVGVGDFSDLAIVETISIDKEVYSIGCRKGSDFDEKINEALVALLNEGKIEELAAKYDVRVTDSLLAMKSK